MFSEMWSLRPGWQMMWIICFALFGCLKAVSLAPELGHVSWSRAVGYLFGWPGLDPRPFRRSATPVAARPGVMALVPAIVELLMGALLIWGIGPRIASAGTLVRGWVGLVGLSLVLHFGFFRLLHWLWNRAGVAVEPIMVAPLLATSPEEFWGRRWNRAFRDFAHAWVFWPAVRRVGPMSAMALVFLFSGVLHDLAISVPAGAGYGRPTAYFGLQFLGVVLQRTALVRRLGLDRGMGGWCLTALFILGPVGWLFHPPFLRVVILPFLEALGLGHGH
jgi:hypothetical protein